MERPGAAMHGAIPRSTPAMAPAPALAPIGRQRKQTIGGVEQVTGALTLDGQWIFELAEDGTWSVGHMPTRTEVKHGLQSLTAGRAYAASGTAREDLARITQAHQETRDA